MVDTGTTTDEERAAQVLADGGPLPLASPGGGGCTLGPAAPVEVDPAEKDASTNDISGMAMWCSCTAEPPSTLAPLDAGPLGLPAPLTPGGTAGRGLAWSDEVPGAVRPACNGGGTAGSDGEGSTAGGPNRAPVLAFVLVRRSWLVALWWLVLALWLPLGCSERSSGAHCSRASQCRRPHSSPRSTDSLWQTYGSSACGGRWVVVGGGGGSGW